MQHLWYQMKMKQSLQHTPFLVHKKLIKEYDGTYIILRRYFETPWRSFDVLNSQHGGCWRPDAYLVPGHLQPSWRNRTVAYLSSCIFPKNLSTFLNGRHGYNTVSFFVWEYFTYFLFLWLHRNIVYNDSNEVYSRLTLFLWSVIQCFQYSLWHYISLNIAPVPLKGTFVFFDIHSHQRW